MRIRLPIAIALLAVLAAGTYWAYETAQLYVFRPVLSGWLRYDLLFDNAILAIPVAALLGVFLGTFRYNKGRAQIINGKVERHDEMMFLQHWSNALGFVILIITGFALGTLFIPRTIQVVEHIGFALNMHFIGVLFFFFAISCYITEGAFTGELKHMLPKKNDLKDMIGHYKAMVFGGDAPKEEKFLAAERVVFPFWIIGLCGITLTGLIKMLAHIWSLPSGLMGMMTFLHGVFAIYLALMLVAHVFAGSLLPASWPLLRSMITGYVSEKYVQHHHEKWYEELQSQNSQGKVEETQAELKVKSAGKGVESYE